MKFQCKENSLCPLSGFKKSCVLETPQDWDTPKKCIYNNSSVFWEEITGKDKNVPAKFPDWCNVGAFVWSDKEGYGKIKAVISDEKIIVITDYEGVCHYKIENLKPARLRPWTFEEAPLSVKVIAKDDASKVVLYLNTEQEPFLTHGACNVDTFSTAMEMYEQLNGSPCGVMEHLNDQGAWVK